MRCSPRMSGLQDIAVHPGLQFGIITEADEKPIWKELMFIHGQ